MNEGGWDTYVIGTPASSAWISPDLTASLPVRFDFRTPSGEGRVPTPDVVAVCPATFNTANKVAAGIADNYATSFICESIGSGIPVTMFPLVNQKLWAHPRWADSLEWLRSAKVRLLDPRTGSDDLKPVESGAGEVVAQDFRTELLTSALKLG